MTYTLQFKPTCLAALLIISGNTWASSCKVIDPELQENYSGPCNIEGLAHGNGVARGIARYEGEFSFGKKHGYGMKQWPKTGDIYIGEFYEDYRHGQGKYVWGEHSTYASQQYIGNYIKDYRDGIGTYLWPNGDKFTGTWKRDVRYGFTYMEIRKKAAHELHITAIKIPGKTVCRNMLHGISNTVFLSGTVISTQDSILNIELTDEAAGFGLYPTKIISIDKEIELWSPCKLD